MTSPCIGCPIVRSCRRKDKAPKDCIHKPATSRPLKPSKPESVTQYFVGEALKRMARQEYAVRMSAIDFTGDF